MSVITISRQLGSLGTEVARQLSERNNCSYMDKKSLESIFDRYGISRENLERFDERKPGFWDLFKSDKARYLHFMKAAIYEYARSGNGVILGRGGQSILSDLPGILHVRVVAPMELRIERVMKYFDCDQSHATAYIQHSDHERAGYHSFFFDKNWEDNNLYDLVINTGSFNAKNTVSLIKHITHSDEFKTTEHMTMMKLKDLCLQHDIRTEIIFNEKILVQFLEVEASNGIVTLRGIVDNKENIYNCEKIATETKGTAEVRNEIYFSTLTNHYGIHY